MDGKGLMVRVMVTGEVMGELGAGQIVELCVLVT